MKCDRGSRSVLVSGAARYSIAALLHSFQYVHDIEKPRQTRAFRQTLSL
jgi:hypothetical protein